MEPATASACFICLVAPAIKTVATYTAFVVIPAVSVGVGQSLFNWFFGIGG